MVVVSLVVVVMDVVLGVVVVVVVAVVAVVVVVLVAVVVVAVVVAVVEKRHAQRGPKKGVLGIEPFLDLNGAARGYPLGRRVAGREPLQGAPEPRERQGRRIPSARRVPAGPWSLTACRRPASAQTATAAATTSVRAACVDGGLGWAEPLDHSCSLSFNSFARFFRFG